MFFPIRFKTSVHLTPMELTVDFEDTLLQKLRKNLEGICSRHGYIKPSTLEIVRRSGGQFVKQHFNGHIRFDVVCRAEVCNPPQNTIVEAIVKNKNELGVHAESSLKMGDQELSVLDIIIPKKAAGIQSEIDLSELNPGDRIYVEVLGKRFQLNDRKISIIGRGTRNKKQVEVQEMNGDDQEEADDEGNPFYEEEDDISDVESGSDEEKGSDDEEQEGGQEDDAETEIAVEDEDKDEEEQEVEYEYDDLGSEVEEAEELSDIEDY